VKSSVSVTQEVDGTGRLDLVFINLGSEPLGVVPGRLSLAPAASPECKAEGTRLESEPYGSSIDTLGHRYQTFTPPGAWAHRQLRVPATLMNVGCVFRFLWYAGPENSHPPVLESALIVPLRVGYSTPLELPMSGGSAPGVASSSEFDVRNKTNVVHVLYNVGGDADKKYQVTADVSSRCANPGTRLKVELPYFDGELEKQRVVVGAGQWSSVVLWANGARTADGCSLTTKLVRRSSSGDFTGPATEMTVTQTLAREREFFPDEPIP
jgi:hypothetical protein